MRLKAEGWHRAGIVVVAAATVTVLVDVEVKVGVAAVTKDVITIQQEKDQHICFLTAGGYTNTPRQCVCLSYCGRLGGE